MYHCDENLWRKLNLSHFVCSKSSVRLSSIHFHSWHIVTHVMPVGCVFPFISTNFPHSASVPYLHPFPTVFLSLTPFQVPILPSVSQRWLYTHTPLTPGCMLRACACFSSAIVYSLQFLSHCHTCDVRWSNPSFVFRKLASLYLFAVPPPLTPNPLPISHSFSGTHGTTNPCWL